MQSRSYSIYPTLLDSFYWCERLNKPLELLDKINRVKGPMPEAAQKGVEFEDCVNTLLKGGSLNEEFGNYVTKGYRFNRILVDRIVKKLANNSGQQKYVQAIIDTPRGKVKLYGFVDFIYPKMYVDLKTTGKYSPWKYEINNQHGSYGLIAKQNGKPIDHFNYLVTNFEDMFVEPYECTPELFDTTIQTLCTFIDWLEENRNKITDTKIFSL